MWLLGLLLPAAAWGQWQEHRVRQGDGHGGWTTWPAWRQVLKYPDADHTMPFGLVRMDNGEVVILCSREKTPRTGSASSNRHRVQQGRRGDLVDVPAIPGTTGRPQYFEWLGGGRLSFITEVFDGEGGPQRVFSNDHGRTWTERIDTR